MDFLLVLIKVFARCYRWDATSEYCIDWKSAFSLQRERGQFDPEFQVEGVPPATILLLTK